MPEIEGLILLSAYDTQEFTDKKLELNMPIFDIVGQFDYNLAKKEMMTPLKVLGRKKKIIWL